MKKLVIAALAASLAAIPTSAIAQRSTILVVDTERVMAACTACRSATTQLQQRQAALRSRATQLNQQIQREGKPIQDAYNALNGKQPDAALQQRITAFQNRQRSANEELATSERTLQSTAAHVQQQIGARLIQIVEQVRVRRAAALVLSKSSTLANDPTAEVTAEVLASLNQQLPAVSVTPLPQQQQQRQPQGR